MRENKWRDVAVVPPGTGGGGSTVRTASGSDTFDFSSGDPDILILPWSVAFPNFDYAYAFGSTAVDNDGDGVQVAISAVNASPDGIEVAVTAIGDASDAPWTFTVFALGVAT